ncbi:MAG TPA: cobalamin-binding protein [Hyphomicrobium sp.]|nr:cobalamin-binding protein [Hyphomicrobium sp.]
MTLAASHVTSPRVVSLITSATEILHALGGGDLQVARSHECDWPPGVLDLPQLTRPKFKVAGSSRDIDIAVKALVEQGLAVYEVDADRMKCVAPDVILTQDQCEVCAVSLADVQRAVATWTECRAEVISLRPHTMADIYADNQRIADALGRSDAGLALNASMRSRLVELGKRSIGLAKPRLAFVEWIDPPMSGGHWMPELIAMAGGVDLLGTSGTTSPWISVADVVAVDPDVILVAPCGYDLEKTRAEMAVLDGNPDWRALRAVREGRVFIADGNAYFNRPGPRLVDSAEIIFDVLHTRLAGYGHLGTSVVRHCIAD